MSTTIDERVLEMRFDNRQFESNVSTTMSTLDKLKQKLNFTGASKGLDSINTATKNVNMAGLGNAVETVTAKFSALQVMGVTALANITNSAVNAGKNIVKSLTIDPIKSGFSEYETKMGSIQTILANTEHQGTTLDDVTAALEKLNLYADKTIYNFEQMTRNIGTFTAAGVDLDTSVKSIQGIANLAAVSGSTSQQASTAMYQLSQALASGTVKLMDWNSVVNAGMGGKVFQNALIRTAAMLDGAASDVETWQKNHIDKFGSFRDSLTEGAWLTTDVLTKTLEQFTMAAEEGSEEWQEFKKSLMADGYTEKQAEEILKMANTATDAATKVKTFTQLMDTLKESAQSGWAQTWELLIGDFEEAKEFFTGLSDMFGEIIGKSAERRNGLLGGALDSNWDKLIDKIGEAGIKTSEFEESIRKVVGDDKLDGLIDDYGSLDKAAKAGAISSDDLKAALDKIAGTNADGKIAGFVEGLKEIERTLQRGHVGEDVKKLQTALDELGYDLGEAGIDGIIGPVTEKAIKAFQEANGIIADGIVGPETMAALEKAGAKVEETAKDVDGLKESCHSLIDVITEKSGRELLLDSLMNVIKAIQRPLAAVGEAFRDVFSISPDRLYNALEKINKFTNKLTPKGLLDSKTWKQLITGVTKLGIKYSDFIGKLEGTLDEHGVDVEELKKKYGDLGKAFEDGAISFDVIKETLLSFDGITESLLIGGETAEKIRRTFEGLFAIFEIIATLAAGPLKIGFKIVTEVLGKLGLSLLDVTAKIGDSIVSLRDNLDKVVGAITELISGNVAEWISEFKETEFFKTIAGWFEDGSETISNAVDTISEKIRDFDTSSLMQTLSTIGSFLSDIGKSLANSDTFVFIVDSVCSAFERLKDFFGGFKLPEFNLDNLRVFTGFMSAFEGANGIGGAFAALGAWIKDRTVTKAKKAINGIFSVASWDEFKATAIEKFTAFWSSVGDKIKTAFEKCKEVLRSISEFVFGTEDINLPVIMDAVQKFLGIVVLIKTLQLLNTLSSPLDNITDAIDNLAGKLKWEAISGAFKSMALALGTLTACIVILANMPDMGKATKAAVMLGGLLVIMGGVIAGLMTLAVKLKTKDALDVVSVALSLALLIGAVYLLTKTLEQIDSMTLKDPVGTFISLGLMLLGLAAGIKIIAAAGSSSFKSVAAILTLVAALKMVLDVITAYDEYDWTGKGDAIMYVAGMLVILSTAINIASRGIKSNAGAGGLALLLLAMVFSLKILLGVIGEFAAMPTKDLIKGGAVIAALLGMMAAVMVAISLVNQGTVLEKGQKSVNNFVGLATALLAVVAAIWILGKMDTNTLIQGGLAVTGILLLFTGMLAAIGKTCSGLKMGSIITLLIGIGILMAEVAVILHTMKDIPWESSLSSVVSLSTLLLVMAGVFKILTKIDANPLAILKWVGAMIVLGGLVVILAYVISKLDSLNPAASIGNAIALSALLLALAVSMKIASSVGTTGSLAIDPMFAMVGVLALVAVIVGVLEALDVAPSIETAISLSTLLLALAGVTAVLTLVGAGAPAALGGIAAFAIVVAGVGAVMLVLAGLAKLFPGLQSWLDTGIDILGQIGTGIGKFVGGIIGGIGEGMMDSVLEMVNTFGQVVDKLVEISEAGTGINTEGFDGIGKLIKALAGIALTSTGTTIADIFTSLFSGQTTMEKFQTDAVAFFDAMKAIGEASSGITVDSANLEAIVEAGRKLADLQSCIEPIGGLASCLMGFTDLGTFGNNVKKFIESMKIALDSLWGYQFDAQTLDGVVTAAGSLAKLQSSLEPIGGVISWFTGRDDLGTFGTNIGLFLTSIKTALTSLDGFQFDHQTLDEIIAAAASLAKLQSSLEPIGGVISWFSGRDDLGTFGTNIGVFISSMKTALATLEGTVLDEAALTSVITAAEKLAALQSQLEPMGSVITWFTGRTDLGTFGVNIGLFADAMGKLKTAMGENGITEAAVVSITNAGNAIIALQDALPEEGWFDGKMNLSEFSDYVTDFGTAMSTFGESAAGIDSAAVSTSINTANRIRNLIESLVGLDTSGLAAFTGIGTGGIGADGAAYKIGKAISSYADEVVGIDTGAVSTSVTAALKLKSLIAGLVGLDASGVENFKIGSIGSAMKTYGDSVSSLDASTVSSSISAASRLKNFISSLVGLDTSGIGSFKSAIDELATVNVSELVKAFSGASEKLAGSGAKMIEGLVKGMKSKVSSVSTVVNDVLAALNNSITSKASIFDRAGAMLMAKFASGLSSRKNAARAAVTSCITSAVSSIRGYHTSFYSAGSYLVEGFAAGISAKTFKAAAAAAAMANAAEKAAREALDINSPSRVFREIGMGIPEGFVQGIEKLSGSVDKSVTNMADNAVSTVGNTISKLASAINTDIDSQPTIRPVLDLSDVRSGAAAIGNLFDTTSQVGVMANVGAVSSMMRGYGQNGGNNDIVSAIDKLRKDLGNISGDTYSVGNVTYDDGSNIADAVRTITRVARMERRT